MAAAPIMLELDPGRPVLHLSGPKLRSALERLVGASERLGGVERFAQAVRLKSVVFQDRLGDGRATALDRTSFQEMTILMATVRRRIAPLVEGRAWEATHAAIIALLDGAHDTTIVDKRVAAFCSALCAKLSPSHEGQGEGRRVSDRFLRDLASEILHNTLPEHYPLMQRWVWDAKSNSGVIREIWHDPVNGSDDTDRIVIDIPDNYETHLVLREELSQFLADNGVFRDMLWHVDLLCAQIYGDYINAQGGAWLKTDFAAESDPLEQPRRILGLDRIARRAEKTTIDGAPAAFIETKQFS